MGKSKFPFLAQRLKERRTFRAVARVYSTNRMRLMARLFSAASRHCARISISTVSEIPKCPWRFNARNTTVTSPPAVVRKAIGVSGSSSSILGETGSSFHGDNISPEATGTAAVRTGVASSTSPGVQTRRTTPFRHQERHAQ